MTHPYFYDPDTNTFTPVLRIKMPSNKITETKNSKIDKKIQDEYRRHNTNSSDEQVNLKNTSQQDLIMLPAYLKAKSRIEGEIKKLEQQVQYEKANGNDTEATKFETQKEMYQQQLNDLNNKIKEEKEKMKQENSFGLVTEDTKTEEEKMIEQMQKETLDVLQEEQAKKRKEEEKFKPEYGLE